MTNPITPQEAQQLLDESDPGPWKIEEYDGCPEAGGGGAFLDVDLENEYNLALAASAPDLAKTIAADTIEYALEYEDPDFGTIIAEHGDGYWGTLEDALSSMRSSKATYRLVARRVSPTWEVKE